MDWGIFQSAGVKVTWFGETKTSVISGLEISKTTLDTGASSNVILNEVGESVSLRLNNSESILKTFGGAMSRLAVLGMTGSQR